MDGNVEACTATIRSLSTSELAASAVECCFIIDYAPFQEGNLMRLGLIGIVLLILIVAAIMQNVAIGGLGGLILLVLIVLLIAGKI